MEIDPRNLRPAELCPLLNSTPLGAVINERQLYRHRNRAGYRLGDGNKIDLLPYVAWLVEEVHRPRATSASDDYEALKERSRARNAAIAKAGRDIGERVGKRIASASGSSIRSVVPRPPVGLLGEK